MWIFPKYRSDKGFTILETLIALTILSTVFVSLLSIQSTTLAILQTSKRQIETTWVMKSVQSQVDYVLDVYGADGIPTSERVLDPFKDGRVKVSLSSEDVAIPASKLISVTLKLGKSEAAAMAEEKPPDEKGDLPKDMLSMVDQYVPKDLYKIMKATLRWKDDKNDWEIQRFIVNLNKVSAGSGMLGGLSALSGLGGLGGAAPAVSPGSSKSSPTKGTP